MVGKRHGCLGLRPSPPGRDAFKFEASLPDVADHERLAADHSGRGTTHRGVVRAGIVSLPVAPSGNGELSAMPSRGVASMDLGAEAGEVEVPSEGLSPETGHVEDTCSVMFVEIGSNLKDEPEEELPAGALETPSDDTGRSRNRCGTPNTTVCSACPRRG